MLTNPHTGTRIDEVAPGIYRINTPLRIFPLLELGSAPSRHAAQVADHLREIGLNVQIEGVGYEFQRGGNRMMRVRR